MAETPTVGSIVFNTNDVEVLVRFWSELLDLHEVRRFPGFVWLSAVTEGGPGLAFQQVPEAKAGNNRLHLDLGVADREAAVARVEQLGGTRVEDHEVAGFHWTVLEDPEGNEFCIAGGLT
jgi:catechol 2,3-dioxygenase-like lactoylglutathione lyase family enzyme